MFKPYRGECNQCNEEKLIANSRGVCIDCTYQNNHGGKTKAEVQKERQKGKVQKKKPIKKTTRKSTGERDLFVEIWNERPHYCENCKESLGGEPKVHYFSHIKSKGAYPSLRLVKSNIELLCLQCHQLWDFGDRNEFKNRKR